MLADNLRYQNLSAGLREDLGFVDLIDADPRNARRLFLDSLDTARITGVTSYPRGALLGLALAAGADGDPTVAATLHGVADEHNRPDGLSRASKWGYATATMPGCAPRWAMPRSRPLTGTAARSARPTPSPWPSAQPTPIPGLHPPSPFRPPARRRRTVQQACCRNESGRSWRCWPGGDRRPDRRAAVPVGQHGQIAPGADPGQDRRPPARGTGPLRHPGWHRSGRPFHLRAGLSLARRDPPPRQ